MRSPLRASARFLAYFGTLSRDAVGDGKSKATYAARITLSRSTIDADGRVIISRPARGCGRHPHRQAP